MLDTLVPSTRCKIGDVCQVVPGYAFKSSDWQDTGIKIVKIKNIREDCTVDLHDADCVSEELLTPKLKKFSVHDGDILVAMTGATAGKVGRVRIQEPALLNQRVAKILPVDIEPDYLWAVLSSNEYQEKLFHLADGAAQPNMSGGQIEGLEIPRPTRAEQRRIAGILSTYDDLIENCRRRIQILEEMVRSLYREWFVHFRYPGHESVPLVPSLLGPIPQGWEGKRVGDCVTIFRGRSYKSSELVEEGGLPFLNLKCMDRDGGFRRSGIKRFDGKVKPEHLVKRGDIVMAVTDMTQERRIVARAARVPTLDQEAGVLSMDLVRIEAQGDIQKDYLYSFFRYSEFANEVKNHANGANVLHLSPDRIRDFTFALPSLELRLTFGNLAGAISSQVDVLENKVDNYRSTRDLLLPRLLSQAASASTITDDRNQASDQYVRI